MISYEEALKTARQHRNDLVICLETTNAFIFKGKDDDNYDGGEYTPIVIMKEDGAAKMITWYVMNCPGEDIREFRI